MAMAPVAYELWQRFLRFDPEDPIWPNRDRFVLSAGHASMLLYSLLHLTRVKAVDPDYETLGELSVKLDDIKHFRQLDSQGGRATRSTAGPPASRPRPARSARASATSVGMAIARTWLAAHFNRPGFELFDFDVYVLARRRRPDGGRLLRGGLDRRPPAARRTSAGSTTTTASRSTAARSSPSATTSPPASSARAGTSRASATRTTSTMLDRAFETFKHERRPADADRRRQPHRLRRPRRPGHGRRPRRAARRGRGARSRSAATAGPRTRSS